MMKEYCLQIISYPSSAKNGQPTKDPNAMPNIAT